MFKFEHILYLYGLLAIPLFLVLFIGQLISRKRRLKKVGNFQLVNQLVPNSSKTKRILKFCLFSLAFASVVLALCNLQTGSKMKEVKREGADIIVCLDVSRSMLTQDLTPNRLERAKIALEKMIDRLEGDRLGLVIFAGEAYVQVPITTDYTAAKLFMSSISTEIVPVQGTNLAAALRKGIESFADDKGKNRAIVLITDGENHEEEALEAADEAAKAGIMINTIGIGSVKGSPIPNFVNGRLAGYKLDKQGATIISKLNVDLLKEIAAKGNGAFVQASNTDIGLNAVLDKINELDKKQFESKMYTDYEDQFQWFVALALLLLVIEFIISERISNWYKKLNLFGNAS